MKKTKLLISLFLLILLLSPKRVPALERYDYSVIKEHLKTPPPSFQTTTPADALFSLKKAISTAITNNPDAKIALAKIWQSSAMLKKAKAAFWPKFNVYTKYSRGDAPSDSLFKTIDQRLFENGTNFNDPGIYKNIETGITGRLNLFNGGRDGLGKLMAEEDLTIAGYDEQSTRNRITSEVIHIWYDMLSAEEYIRISKESMETVRAQLDIMTVKYEGGSAFKSDILSLKVRLAQAEEELVRSRNRLKITRYALKNILGMSPDMEINYNKTAIHPLSVPDSYEKGVNEAFLRRPELQKVRATVRKTRMGMDRARSADLPSVNLTGTYYHDDPEMDYDRDRENWTIGLALDWNIFSGFSHTADKSKSHALMKEVLAADRKTVLGIQLDVRNAYLMLDESTARLEVARKSVAMARETLHLVQSQYEGGSATITRYLEAELAKNSAEIRATAAHFDHEKATADIARATGLFIKEPEPMDSTSPENAVGTG